MTDLARSNLFIPDTITIRNPKSRLTRLPEHRKQKVNAIITRLGTNQEQELVDVDRLAQLIKPDSARHQWRCR